PFGQTLLCSPLSVPLSSVSPASPSAVSVAAFAGKAGSDRPGRRYHGDGQRHGSSSGRSDSHLQEGQRLSASSDHLGSLYRRCHISKRPPAFQSRSGSDRQSVPIDRKDSPPLSRRSYHRAGRQRILRSK